MPALPVRPRAPQETQRRHLPQAQAAGTGLSASKRTRRGAVLFLPPPNEGVSCFFSDSIKVRGSCAAGGPAWGEGPSCPSVPAAQACLGSLEEQEPAACGAKMCPFRQRAGTAANWRKGPLPGGGVSCCSPPTSLHLHLQPVASPPHNGHVTALTISGTRLPKNALFGEINLP